MAQPAQSPWFAQEEGTVFGIYYYYYFKIHFAFLSSPHVVIIHQVAGAQGSNTERITWRFT